MYKIIVAISFQFATLVGAQEPIPPTEASPRTQTERSGSSNHGVLAPSEQTGQQTDAQTSAESRDQSGSGSIENPLDKSQQITQPTYGFKSVLNSEMSFAILLPWGLAVFMSILSGAAVSYIWVMRKQERHFAALRESIFNGAKPVHLLPEEATRIIREFHQMIRQGAEHFSETVKQQRTDLERIVKMAEDASHSSREDAQRTVETFKGSLNEMLSKISKFMERVVQDTKETHNEAVETKEFAKQVSALIHEKEAEISKLKEGYHIHLISPLTKAFLKIRDDIHALAHHAVDSQIRQQLADLDQRIGHALLDLQIEEIPIQVGERPHEIHHSSLWESLGAAVPTDDPQRHGAVARIQERGYQFKNRNGEPHIIRKAVLAIHSCPSLNGQPEG